jgi:O-antigen/teichoic acid export membrane protein
MAFGLPSFSPTAWITVDSLTQQVLWLILFAILAPILGPRPYGLFSIVMVFVGFSEFVLIEGSVEALVTVDQLDYLHTTTANLASCGIALTFALVISAFAPVIGLLFHDEEIKRIIWTLAPLPVLSSLSSTPIAVMRRSLQYKQLALRSIAGLTLGGIFGIVLAVLGAGVWALVFQVLAQRIAELTIAWISVPIRLGFKWSGTHFSDIRPVGTNLFAARAMIFAGGQLPRLILGYALGPTEVGLFTLANRFLDVIVHTTISPRAAVGRIELRTARIGSTEFQRIYSKMVENVTVLSVPVFFGAAALAPDLFRIWLDQRWLAGVIPAQLIILSGLPLALFYCFDSALLAGNLSSVLRRMAKLQTLTISATVLCTVPFGLNVVCIALAARQWILLPIFLLLFGRACHMPSYSALRPSLRALIGAVIMAALLNVPFLRPSWRYQDYNFILLIAAGVGFYFIYLYIFARDQLKALLVDIFFHRI